MRIRKSGTLALLPTRSDSNGFVNRRSRVRFSPPAPGPSNPKKLSSGAQFIADAMAAGVSEIGARRLLRDLRSLVVESENAGADSACIQARADLLTLGAL